MGATSLRLESRELRGGDISNPRTLGVFFVSVWLFLVGGQSLCDNIISECSHPRQKLQATSLRSRGVIRPVATSK